MSNRSNECVVSSDCSRLPRPQRCYKEAPFSDDVFFCDCSSWYGWSGNDCDETSVQLHYFRFSLFLCIFASVVIIIYGAKKFYMLYLLQSSGQRSTLLLISGCAILGAGCLLASALMKLPSLFNPDRFVLVTVTYDGEELQDPAVPGGNIPADLILLGIVFYFFTSLTISLSWLHVVEKIPFSRVGPKTIARTKKIMYALEAIFLVLILACIVMQSPAVGSIFVSLGCPMLGVIYFLGRKRLFDELNSIPTSDDLATTKAIILRCFTINLVGLFLASFLSLLHYVLFVLKINDLSVGEFNYIIFPRELGINVCQFLLLYNLHYVAKLEAALTYKRKTATGTINTKTKTETLKGSLDTSVHI